MQDPQSFYNRPDSSIDCPVCGATLEQPFDLGAMLERQWLHCQGCGEHALTFNAYRRLRNPLDKTSRAKLAHAISKRPADDLIDSTQLEHMASAGQLPGALELIDNLLLLMATRAQPGGTAFVRPDTLVAPLGAVDQRSAIWALQEAVVLGQIKEEAEWVYSIRRPGWERHAELLRDGAKSRHAFMAMDFKPSDIQAFFRDHLIAGVARTGFELRTTDHAQKTAGHIDARMRVELRTSRFVVCDLTHNNRGAYWEAGFAEGIGRPVFYLCRKDVHASQDREIQPHFDIAHQAIVKWDPADPAPAVEELVAMIRATLPAEAHMED